MSEYFDQRDHLRRTVAPGQQWVQHHFYFGANLAGASVVGDTLTHAGYQHVMVDSEAGDMNYVHVIAWGWTDVHGAVAESVEEEMNGLALENGGEYRGWTLVRNNDGSLPIGNEPLF